MLPFDNGNYKQAPFEDITEERFYELEKSLSDLDLSKVFEPDDATELQAEAACVGGTCVIV